jgi:hypothetical protein
MRQWFDLHLYLANWGTRRLMMRLPKRLVRRQIFDCVLKLDAGVELEVAGDSLILDISREEIESDDNWDTEEDDSAGSPHSPRCVPTCSAATSASSICFG